MLMQSCIIVCVFLPLRNYTTVVVYSSLHVDLCLDAEVDPGQQRFTTMILYYIV